MMLIVVLLTAATVYIAGKNLRANQQRTLEQQFHSQVSSYLALQEAQSTAIREKCRALSRSVRLRAALEEQDVEDLYRNALTELQPVLGGVALDDSRSVHASFFRFFDGKGTLLPTHDEAAGEIDNARLDEALAAIGYSVRDASDQNIGFVVTGSGDGASALRELIVTNIRDWNGRGLGALVLGFGINDMRLAQSSAAREMKNGIWLDQHFYIQGLSAPDRHTIAHVLNSTAKPHSGGSFGIDLQSGPHLLFYKCLNPASRLAAAYEVCIYPLAAALHEEQVLRWRIVAFGAAVLLTGLTASLFLTRTLARPVDQLAATSAENVTLRKLAEQDLRETNRELEKTLRELKATQQQVIQQERLSALGQMAAGIAHDFNNTLMPILGFADVLLKNESLLDDKIEARRCLEMLRTSAQDAANVVHRLREFYRPIEADQAFPIVDLAKIVEQAVALTKPKWRGLTQARGITVTVETLFAERPIVSGEESALREVLTNLLFNAVDAMPEGGRILIAITAESDRAVLRVSDNGTGMTETVRRRCLEPFFSTKGEQGTGLGLSMVYGIIERHRGELDIESALGKGTTFIIRLPLAEAMSHHSTAEKVVTAGGTLNVLVVDDEPRSREVLTIYLRTDHHAVATASSGREALEKFRRGRFHVVLMDRAMPEMNGEQAARFIKQIKADMPVILLTGFGGEIETNGSDAIDLVLHKPITLDALRRGMNEVVHAA